MSTEAAYQAQAGSPLTVDRELYGRFADESGRTLIESFEIPIRSGQAWQAPAGHVVRLRTVDGPQVGDLNIWNRHDPRERFWAARTRQLHAAHVSEFDRLWSTLPFLRPLATIVSDTMRDHGVDSDGARVHDLLGTRCDPYVNTMMVGVDFDYHCHSNLVRAVQPYRLTEFDVHDVINVFQSTGLNADDQYFMKPCTARPGDHFELFAEIDLLMALSTCPAGDLSVSMWGDDPQDPVENCHPIGVDVYQLSDDALQGWTPPPVAAYRGTHAIEPVAWRPGASG